jgi:hypothetical protein
MYQFDRVTLECGIQLLAFWTLSIVLFFNLKRRFRDRIVSPSSNKNLLSLIHSVDLVPISERMWKK